MPSSSGPKVGLGIGDVVGLAVVGLVVGEVVGDVVGLAVVGLVVGEIVLVGMSAGTWVGLVVGELDPV